MKFDNKMKFYVGLIAVVIALGLIYVFFESTGFVTKTITPCRDSDGGKAYFTYGETYGMGAETKYITTNKDFCEDNYVHEFYCNGNWVYSEEYFCTRGCSKGKCTYGTLIIP